MGPGGFLGSGFKEEGVKSRSFAQFPQVCLIIHPNCGTWHSADTRACPAPGKPQLCLTFRCRRWQGSNLSRDPSSEKEQETVPTARPQIPGTFSLISTAEMKICLKIANAGKQHALAHAVWRHGYLQTPRPLSRPERGALVVSGLGSAFHTLLTGNLVNNHLILFLEVIVSKGASSWVWGRVGALLPFDQTFTRSSLVRLGHGFWTKSRWGLRGACSPPLSRCLSLSKLRAL